MTSWMCSSRRYRLSSSSRADHGRPQTVYTTADERERLDAAYRLLTRPRRNRHLEARLAVVLERVRRNAACSGAVVSTNLAGETGHYASPREFVFAEIRPLIEATLWARSLALESA